MANVIKHKRGSGSDPVANDLVVGEVAIRTDVGKLFTKMDNGSVAEIAGGGSDIAINTLSSSSGTGGGSATFNGSAYRFTLSAPPSVSAQQLLVSINGVIQKPVPGTGQPSEGFSVDGTDIILGDAPAAGSDFFILTFKSLGVSEPADNSVTSAKIVDGAIVNADINASAAIDGTKISPDFGSQTVTTTGTVNTGLINASSASDQILNLNSSDNGAVYLAFKRSGSRKAYFGFGGTGSSITLENEISDGNITFRGNDGGTQINVLHFDVSDNGKATFIGEVNVGDGLDVTGAITGTGDLTIETNTFHVDSVNNRVGIGTTSPDTSLTVQSGGDAQMSLKNSSGTTKAFIGTAGAFGSAGTDDLRIRSDSSNIIFGFSGTERMRITSGGSLCIGVDVPANSEKLRVDSTGSTGTVFLRHGSTDDVAMMIMRHSRNTGGSAASYINFQDSGGTRRGFIDATTSGTTYSTSSDYRLKENITAISDGITRLKTLKPSKFNFIGDSKIVDGFLAHEVTAVPEAVTGTKDEVDADNNPVYQGIDQSKLVPLLVAALQEAIGRIEALEAK